MSKVYFKNLNGLRFISFFLVFIHHCYSSFSNTLNLKNCPNILFEKILNQGDMGVSFFFVLSGFLITFLLLEEKKSKGKINILNFYFRRALRIWPLYYLVMFFGYFIIPIFRSNFNLIPNDGPNPYLCFTFLNNFDRLIHTQINSVISILWTVAIEEQFYLIWPLFFCFLKKKWFSLTIGIVLFSSTFFRFIYKSNHPYIETHTFGVISDMAMGGLFAYLSFYNEKFKVYILQFSKTKILIIYFVTIFIILFKNEIFYNDTLFSFRRIIIGFLFSVIIVEQNFSEKSLFKIEKLKIISKLGIYTYGLYCFHNLAITIVKYLCNSFYIWNQFIFQMLLSLFLSIILSFLSYHLFEIWFLKLKNKYM